MLDTGALEAAHKRFLEAHEQAVRQAMQIVGAKAEQEAAANAPKKSGKLARNTRKRVVRRAGGQVLFLRNRMPYAAAQDGGSRPHVIRGRPYLVFRGRDGNLVRVRSVRHPGTKPTHFLRNAAGNAYVNFGERYAQLMRSRSRI